MKTRNLLIAVTALLMAGCSQNEVTDFRQDADPAIGFDVYTGVATRGTDVTNATMQTTGFGVMGYYTGSKAWKDATDVTPSFMCNQLVTYNTGKWTYSPIKYWPNNKSDKVSFFAYAPYEDGNKNLGIVTPAEDDKTHPSITFTLQGKENLSNMVDLVVAEQLDRSAENSTTSNINFNFEHILTKVSFKAKLGDAYTGLDGTNSFVYITHMWIVGKTNTNSLSILGNKLTNTDSKFYTKAIWQDSKWNYNAENIAKEDYDLTGLLDREIKPITEIWEGNVKKEINGIRLTETITEANLFLKDQFLYLIPVNDADPVTDDTTSGGCGENDIKIGFHYDIVTKSTSSLASAPEYLVSHFESAVPLPAHHMKRGKFYTYTFTINLNEITISSAEVKEWGNQTGEFPIK